MHRKGQPSIVRGTLTNFYKNLSLVSCTTVARSSHQSCAVKKGLLLSWDSRRGPRLLHHRDSICQAKDGRRHGLCKPERTVLCLGAADAVPCALPSSTCLSFSACLHTDIQQRLSLRVVTITGAITNQAVPNAPLSSQRHELTTRRHAAQLRPLCVSSLHRQRQNYDTPIRVVQ